MSNVWNSRDPQTWHKHTLRAFGSFFISRLSGFIWPICASTLWSCIVSWTGGDGSISKDFDQLSTMFGIKGLPLLSALSSLSLPISFPYDFMHLIWANLIPNLILLWTGKFKDLDHNGQDYVIMQTVWNAIGETTFRAGETIPAALGSCVPNIALDIYKNYGYRYWNAYQYLAYIPCTNDLAMWP